MRRFDTSTDSLEAIHKALDFREVTQSAAIESTVKDILADVRERGDSAVLEYTRRFDWPDAPDGGLEAAVSELAAARRALGADKAQILAASSENIRRFHEMELTHFQTWTHRDHQSSGITLGQLVQPVDRAGVYVPGGLAAYPSTVLMSAIPARIAGVREIILCTPADRSGNINPMVAAAASVHADRVFRIGRRSRRWHTAPRPFLRSM
jgi:histidinol dehydrogenase